MQVHIVQNLFLDTNNLNQISVYAFTGLARFHIEIYQHVLTSLGNRANQAGL